MDENSIAYPLPLEKDHEILGAEYCSGYADSFGKWNTGFYCPKTSSAATVFCCGTPVFKYCCTGTVSEQPQPIPNTNTYDEDQNQPDQEIKESTTAVLPFQMNAPVVIGVICGVLAVAIFVVLVSCLYCSCCILYKKRRASLAGGIYRMQGSSTTSGLINTCSSPTNVNSVATTPLDPEWSTSNTTALTQALTNSRRHPYGPQVQRSVFRNPVQPQPPIISVISTTGNNDNYPRDAPPPYNEYPPSANVTVARVHNNNLINQLILRNNLSRANSGSVPRTAHNGLYFPTSPGSTVSSVSSFPTQFSYRTVPRNRTARSREAEIPRNPVNGLNNLSAPPRRHRATRCNSTCSDPCSNRNVTVPRKPRQLPVAQNLTQDFEKILNVSTSESVSPSICPVHHINTLCNTHVPASSPESYSDEQQPDVHSVENEEGHLAADDNSTKVIRPLNNIENNISLSQHSLHT